MDWLNLHTSILHAPEYIGSPPTARATWVNVSLWSAHQENGGRIVGSRDWGNRQWQQTCGVTKREIMSAPLLLVWQGVDLTVWRYPVEKETEVKFNRAIGRNGGSATTEAKRQAARLNGAKGGRPKVQTDETQEPNETQRNPSGNPTEWKGIGIGKEEEDARARGGLPDSLNTARFRERWIRWQTHWADAFNFGNPMPEMTAYQQLEDLVKVGEERAIIAINNSIANGKLKRPAEPFNGSVLPSDQPVRKGMTAAELDKLPTEKFDPLT